MKNIIKNVFLISIVLMGLNSCDKDMNNPNASNIANPNLISPSDGSTLVLNPNTYTATAMTVKWSSLDFGYDASVVYSLQIIKSSDSFDSDGVVPQVIGLGTYSENSNTTHQVDVSTTNLNLKLKALGANIGSVSSFKVRIFGKPAGQLDSSSNGLKAYTQTNIINSNVYDPIDEAAKLYVFGNFGAASSFADWDINTLGTSNSPIIYSSKNNGIYEGFVYMNNALPKFKFANPTDTELNIKGVGTAYTGTAVIGVNDSADPPIPFGNTSGAIGVSTPGTLAASTDVSTGNVISPPSPAAGSYFVKVNWTSNEYVILKRTMSVTGIATSNVAKALTYVTDPASPFYRMYVGENISLSAGSMYVQVKNLSSADGSKLERFGIDNTITTLINSDNSSAMIKNKLKFGAANFTVTIPGVYTIILDLRNSANYNLRAIKTN
ncbi:SusE domain-containing protein [Flavobacterium aciduliphilum]|uniref:SusE-like outer membrane protein n=1 Tax=Flavobacterium aciduliphilum TaxID=1101402 RepID=A0A328YLV1_9FLAO|nr:SusE domain-containing protein [Flavobacterium aciduliphilum]RAR74093.1 SusE-like outer membrane protein [Flavobacterium aciduliphilum]